MIFPPEGVSRGLGLCVRVSAHICGSSLAVVSDKCTCAVTPCDSSTLHISQSCPKMKYLFGASGF